MTSAFSTKRRAAPALLAIILISGIALASCSIWGGETVMAPRYALVYGVSLYQSMYSEGDGYNLSYSDEDAEDMAEELSAKGWSNVMLRCKGDSTTTTPLPSKANLMADISTLATTIESNAIVLIYFSGHGTTSNGTSYFIPYEGIKNTASGGLDLDNCVSPDELSSAIASLPTKNVIVILDSCLSGGFVETEGEIDTAPQNYGTLDDGTAESTVFTAFSNFGELLVSNAEALDATPPIVMTAAGSDDYSYDSATNNNGAFTYYLLESIANGDSNSDNYVSTSEAYDYAREQIISYWNSEIWDEFYYYYRDGKYADFMPRLSGGARDLVLFDLH